jgi:hypothetical protein
LSSREMKHEVNYARTDTLRSDAPVVVDFFVTFSFVLARMLNEFRFLPLELHSISVFLHSAHSYCVNLCLTYVHTYSTFGVEKHKMFSVS